MKTRKFHWAVLPMMAAALVMTACGGDDVADSKPVPVNPSDKTDVTLKTIPYTVTVTGDPETTRATTEGLLMKFADGDQLYVRNTAGDIYGVLTIDEGIGDGSATFSGDLYYEESNPPTTSTSLTATLVSSNDKVADITDDKVTGFTYPTSDNIRSTLADAVSEYSQLQGTANYGSTFVLTQSTAFLKFKVWLEDGTQPKEKAVAVSVTKDGSNTIGTGTVSASGTTRFVDTYAEFYVPVPYNTTITKDANMCVANVGTDDESIIYGGTASKTLSGGKVYNITKTKDFVRLCANGPVWATKNIGASSVTDYGGMYCWGGTTDVTDTSINVYWNSNCPYWVSGYGDTTAKYSKYVTTDYAGNWGGEGTTPDNKTVLEAVDDVATQTLGSSWHIPTYTEMTSSNDVIMPNTKYQWTTVNGITGGMFYGNSSLYKNKAIFLPAAGRRYQEKLIDRQVIGSYWMSTLSAKVTNANSIYIKSAGVNHAGSFRHNGYSIRPVRN